MLLLRLFPPSPFSLSKLSPGIMSSSTLAFHASLNHHGSSSSHVSHPSRHHSLTSSLISLHRRLFIPIGTCLVASAVASRKMDRTHCPPVLREKKVPQYLRGWIG